MNSAWYNIYATITFVVVGSGKWCGLSWDAHRFLYFLRSSCILWTPRLKTSDLVTPSFLLQSFNLLRVSESIRNLIVVFFGLSVGRPIFLFPNVCTSFIVGTNSLYVTYPQKSILFYKISEKRPPCAKGACPRSGWGIVCYTTPPSRLRRATSPSQGRGGFN